MEENQLGSAYIWTYTWTTALPKEVPQGHLILYQKGRAVKRLWQGRYCFPELPTSV